MGGWGGGRGRVWVCGWGGGGGGLVGSSAPLEAFTSSAATMACPAAAAAVAAAAAAARAAAAAAVAAAAHPAGMCMARTTYTTCAACAVAHPVCASAQAHTWGAPKPSVEVFAGGDVACGGTHVHAVQPAGQAQQGRSMGSWHRRSPLQWRGMQHSKPLLQCNMPCCKLGGGTASRHLLPRASSPVEQPQRGQRAVAEPRVHLAPLVAPEGAVGLLQACHVCSTTQRGDRKQTNVSTGGRKYRRAAAGSPRLRSRGTAGGRQARVGLQRHALRCAAARCRRAAATVHAGSTQERPLQQLPSPQHSQRATAPASTRCSSSYSARICRADSV